METEKKPPPEEADEDTVTNWEVRAKELETQVQELREQADATQNRHEEEIADLHDACGVAELEGQTRIDELEHELVLAKQRTANLEVEKAGLIVLREENERLSKLLIDIQDQMSELMAEHANVAHGIKRESFDARLQLEHTFRKTLQELEKKLHQQAFDQMDKESRTALIDRARVQDELALQTVGIEALTKRYNEKSALVQTLRTDKCILKEHLALQSKKMSTLKQQVGKLESRRIDLEESLEAAQAEAADASALRSRVKELETLLDERTTAHMEAEARADDYKAKHLRASEKLRAIELGKKGKRKLPSIAKNDALFQALAGLGRSATSTSVALSGSQDGGPETLGNEALVGPSLRDNKSVPALPKSTYTGILETWNAKFNQKRDFY
ncbi:Hypothetical Protein FCC1311_007012 [Hondaea fermentalgiana]|uniref:Uncharacterized protein n=1 Tax=Hondaea fermentalgiana TaxID=2315210 RepID=A0A2R5G7N1_9STRA|nr:Hypothetical Protein FCC1311_007012 [Hondaea fermentalgiana]|eukprot:GBG24483.1 Hypothetical Protein FCC1311_007012 [Hondaea fermentalgiana]